MFTRNTLVRIYTKDDKQFSGRLVLAYHGENAVTLRQRGVGRTILIPTENISFVESIKDDLEA